MTWSYRQKSKDGEKKNTTRKYSITGFIVEKNNYIAANPQMEIIYYGLQEKRKEKVIEGEVKSSPQKKMKDILLTLWQLPQCILGWILLLFYKETDFLYYKRIYTRYSPQMKGGISLGTTIILSDTNPPVENNTLKHEYGHCRQSQMLGWLYLIVIGLPSLIWAMVHKGDYYSFWTERWADKLGGVER